jgi:hypothetical protein
MLPKEQGTKGLASQTMEVVNVFQQMKMALG